MNVSLQMLHRNTSEVKNDKDENDSEGKEKIQSQRPVCSIGGTLLGSENDAPKISEDTIYFGGDVMKASYAVLDGKNDRDDFSFIIGASCWAPGQLANEIERGCWLPFRGPPQIAMQGMVDHNDVPVSASEDEHVDADKGTKLSLFPPRPSNTAVSSVAGSAAKAALQQSGQPAARPVGDLWLSIMCALGEGEADLAYMLQDDKSVTNKFGDACDNFDR